MVEFKINDEIIDPGEIWFHHQDEPDGEWFFKVIFSLDEKNILKKMEKLICTIDKNEEFIAKSINKQDSFYNIVSYVIWSLEEEKRIQKKDVKWVFNKITDVKILLDDQIIEIKGMASKFVIPYVRRRI